MALSAFLVILLLQTPVKNITGINEMRTIAIRHPLVIEITNPEVTRLIIMMKEAILLPIACCRWLVWMYIFSAISVDLL